MFKKVIQYHLFPLVIALLCTAAGIAIYRSMKSTEVRTKEKKVVGQQQKQRGVYANLLEGDDAEIDYMASIKHPQQLTIFGSSELSGTPYASYHFLPDTLGIPCMAVGHGFHQELSILVELLAAYDYLEDSKVCIILSPGWFETDGTNIESFIEFARPNFLDRIVHDARISEVYKKHIGQFINEHYSDINGVSNSMDQLRNLYLSTSHPAHQLKYTVKESLMPVPQKVNMHYDFELLNQSTPKVGEYDFKTALDRAQKDFLTQVTTNAYYINDDYYNEYVLQSDGSERLGGIQPVDLNSTAEYDDFKLLLQLLKERNVDASFIMQPLNPYYYEGMEYHKENTAHMKSLVENAGFPFLDLYVVNRKEYQPGMLTDIMHLGDYGWLTINEFLMHVYYE